MQKFYLENMNLKITINQHGAEIADILNKENGVHYLWNGDPTYWKRTAPVLFPIVGSLKDGKYRAEGKTYEMSQHGFARDTDFEMKKQKDGKSILFSLSANEATKELYPYDFQLEIRHTLDHYKLTTEWSVTNTDQEPIHFQIGGHPAFFCPPREGENRKDRKTDEYLVFDTDGDLKYSLLNQQGLVESRDNVLKTDSGVLPVTEEMFDHDALIFEKTGVHRVSLCNHEKIAYVTVSFDAPLFGIWSPAGKKAPFLCIEPWYGRADAADFSGEIQDREYDNALQPGETFHGGYTIEIHS